MNAIISIIIYVIASLAFIIIGPIVLLITFINPSNSSTYIIPFCKFMIIVFGCKLKVYGHFPKNETFVIMANHVSFLDVFAIPCAFDTSKKFSAVAASKNFKIPIYSIFLKKMRVVSIDRSNREQSASFYPIRNTPKPEFNRILQRFPFPKHKEIYKTIIEYSNKISEHRFDLLGSGEIKIHHGVKCSGFHLRMKTCYKAP